MEIYSNMGKYHLIATGGAVMHNLALALHHMGNVVTGSDDEIKDPSKTRLEKYGLLPAEMGWFPEKVHAGLDAVILGMHARIDNPELIRAKELGLNIYSFPEFIYEQSKDKTRVVIGGSHGKTTITSMVMHVLKTYNKEFDYLVGSQLEGFETMVKLSDAPVIILEGDEYLASPIDRRPKFHLYHPQIALLSGIAWDHINVFPTYENYLEQFEIFTQMVAEDGYLTYAANDADLEMTVKKHPLKCKVEPYNLPNYFVKDGRIQVLDGSGNIWHLEIFGKHNLINMEGAKHLCMQLGIAEDQFYLAMQNFKGAARRLEKIYEKDGNLVFRDFAHSPSKLKATVEAVRETFPDKHIVACMELHTFSSVNANFLKEYNGSMNLADEALVYLNPETIAHKKLPPLPLELVKENFGREDLFVCPNSSEMKDWLSQHKQPNSVYLLMSSGTFEGFDLTRFKAEL